MNWNKKDLADSIAMVVERNTGMKINDLIKEYHTPITNLPEAVELIKETMSNKERITIFGDYDADGITSSAILFAGLKAVGVTPNVRLPRRYSEGYGMSVKAVDEIDSGTIITVDNGIAAIEAIEKAKKRGLKVIVLDHHLCGDILPIADVIVDPHYKKENDDDFEDFCGAGLALRFILELIGKEINPKLEDFLYELAAIGTVADVMPLIKDNRSIVVRGLSSMNAGSKNVGLRTLFNELDITFIDEETIGFKIGPTLNAAGRLIDDGAILSFDLLTGNKRNVAKSSLQELSTMAIHLKSVNEQRKCLTKEALERAEVIIASECLFGNVPLIIYDEETPEGILGLVASKISEKFKVPSIILTSTKENPEIVKGSARSYGGVNLKAELDRCSDILLGYGGHEGAAGLSLKKDNISDLMVEMGNNLIDYEAQEQSEIDYDLEISAEQLPETIKEIKKYAPYGQHNEKIMFKINDFELSPRYGNFYNVMGDEGQHLKLFGNNCSAVGFDMINQYNATGLAKTLNLLGTIGINVFNGKTEVQISLVDFVPILSKKTTALSDLLAKKMKSF